MFDQIFLSPQVKRSVIISNKHSIYKLPNDARRRNLKDLRELGNIRKASKGHRIIA